jgi:hypothetical protein
MVYPGTPTPPFNSLMRGTVREHAATGYLRLPMRYGCAMNVYG